MPAARGIQKQQFQKRMRLPKQTIAQDTDGPFARQHRKNKAVLDLLHERFPPDVEIIAQKRIGIRDGRTPDGNIHHALLLLPKLP